MDFAALFAVQRKSVSVLRTSIAHIFLCLLPKNLEHPISCAASSHHVPSHRTCTMICVVGVSSCALCVRWQSVVLGHECFSPAHSRRRLRPCRPSRRSTQCHSHHFSHLTLRRTSTDILGAHHVVVLRFLLAWTCLPRSKNWFAAVKGNLLPLYSSVCNRLLASTSVGLYLIGAAAPDVTFTNKPSTSTLTSFLSPDFSFVSLFLMYASFFPMNK